MIVVSQLDPLVVARRFRGPDASGNGGYTAGLLARRMLGEDGVARQGRAITVTLRRPPPLDVALPVAPVRESPGLELREPDSDALVAVASAGTFSADLVHTVDFATATAARTSYAGLVHHPFPGCFVCGPDRDPGDGMRLAPGPVAAGRTACVWVPDPTMATAEDPG